MCNEEFDLKDAKVACRMMGYSKAVRVLTNESYSPKSGHMLMSQLQCDGTEDQLSHCDYDDAYGCILDKAVALQCGSKLFHQYFIGKLYFSYYRLMTSFSLQNCNLYFLIHQ